MNGEPDRKKFFEENVESNFAEVEHHHFLPRRQHISKRLSLVLNVCLEVFPIFKKLIYFRNLVKFIRC